jgi:hypothetical protein
MNTYFKALYIFPLDSDERKKRRRRRREEEEEEKKTGNVASV